MRVDCHAHVLPPAYRVALGDMPLPPTRLEDLKEMMARYAVDAAVISTGPPGAFIGDPSAGPELARLANNGIAEIVRAEPRTFAGLATLPLPDVDSGLRELERSLDELGLDGVMLLSNVAGIYLGDQRFEPLMNALNDRGAYVFIHPGFPPQAPPLPHPVWLYEFTFETVRAVTNLIYTGTLERYPQIHLQLAHLGGAVPFLAHRLASLADREPGLAAEAPAGALAYLRDLYYDTGLANNEPALAATLKIASADQVVFGTDWPYASLPAAGGDPAPGLDVLGAQTRAAIEFENAAALVPRLVDSLMADDRSR
jgi:predicted TIM-barrel fold metal-dependent hydrolase